MNATGSALRISAAAMIVALSVVISGMPSLPGPITKFSGFPLLLGGLLIGPRTAFAVGCLTDLVGFMIRPTGAFFPGFTLTQGLTALLPALAVGKREPITWLSNSKVIHESKRMLILAYLRILLVFGATQFLTSVLMVSYFTSKIVLGTPLEYELVKTAIAQITHVPVYAFMALAVLRGLSHTDLYPRLLKARR